MKNKEDYWLPKTEGIKESKFPWLIAVTVTTVLFGTFYYAALVNNGWIVVGMFLAICVLASGEDAGED